LDDPGAVRMARPARANRAGAGARLAALLGMETKLQVGLESVLLSKIFLVSHRLACPSNKS
jgi:hypothetical protein